LTPKPYTPHLITPRPQPYALGAPAKQTNIAHCTLLRAFPDPDAESGVVLDPRRGL